MRALIMAAGLGTRLRPLTDKLPKPLVKVGARPMVEFVLEQLARNGVTEAIMNVHYLPGQLRDFTDAWNVRGGVPRLEIQDESREILGSGGAVALAAEWLFELDDCAVIYNSDLIAEPDLLAMAAQHRRLAASHGVECTLSAQVHPEAGVKYTGLRREGDLITSLEQPGTFDPALWQFPSFYILGAAAVKRLPPANSAFSIAEKLWRPLAAERKLGAWTYQGIYFDLGTVEDVRAAAASLFKGR